MITYPYKICDPIHHFIRFNALEKRLIDSLPFQRLRYIKQMGVGYLLYPGAQHTRFEHSLGVMELSSRIFDSILAENKKPEFEFPEDIQYFRQVVRIASLAHDLGHLPFSHTAERELLGEKGHEEMTRRILDREEFDFLWKELSKSDVIKISTGDKSASPWEKMLSQIIVDDHFGSDRIDYLLRDSHFTGVQFGLFDYHQLIDTLRIIPYAGKLTLGISESGLQAVESLLMARYLMFSRVYHHPKTRLHSYHMSRALVHAFQRSRALESLDAFLEENDFTLLSQIADLAKGGDFDAKAILKKGPLFEEIPYEKELPKEKDLYFLDQISPRQTQSDFLILKDTGEVSHAGNTSPLLKLLPEQTSLVRLYIHPSIKVFKNN